MLTQAHRAAESPIDALQLVAADSVHLSSIISAFLRTPRIFSTREHGPPCAIVNSSIRAIPQEHGQQKLHGWDQYKDISTLGWLNRSLPYRHREIFSL